MDFKNYNFTVTDRFVKYAKIDTQSDPTSSTCPSTEKQKNLGNVLVEELKQSLSKETASDNTEFLKTTMDYNGLINSFSKKLGRVLSRYS